MQYGPPGAVKYVVVYDNVAETTKLETMFPSSNATGITVGLQFTSYMSGLSKFRIFSRFF